MVPAGSHPSQY